MRQTAGVNRGKTSQQKRIAGHELRQNAAIETQKCAPNVRRIDRAAMPVVNRTQSAPTENARLSVCRTQTDSPAMPVVNRPQNLAPKAPPQTSPPRAHTPVPALKPAERSAAPARNSQSCEKKLHSAAPAITAACRQAPAHKKSARGRSSPRGLIMFLTNQRISEAAFFSAST